MKKNDERGAYIMREGILELLSDDEVARVSTAETEDHLTVGDEYLDLEQLNQGVLRASANSTPMGRVLPRAAIHPLTWEKILRQLTELNEVSSHEISV